MSCDLPQQAPLVMDAQRRLQQLLGMDAALAARVVAETLDAFGLEIDDYIHARHAQLQRQGFANSKIYTRIAAELPTMRFLAKRMSPRQIRRRIYG